MLSYEDIFLEADEDETTQAPADDDAGGDDEDFDIDTTLDVDDDDTTEDDGEDEVDDTGETTGGDEGEETGGGGGSTGCTIEDSGTEPVEANTKIFSSFTAEEQEVKIKELKAQFRDLYLSIDDQLHRIEEMDLDEDMITVMPRVTLSLHKLKQSLADYFDKHFDAQSYEENDFKFNELSMILNSISDIIEDLAKSKEKKIGKETADKKL